MSVADMGDLEKVERQEQDCRAVCDRMGWIPAETFVDNNKSAWRRNRKRKRWDAMLEGISTGRFDAIVVYHGDRLIRQPYDLELLLSLADQRGIRLASPTGTRNLDSPDDRFILRIEAAQACRESDNTSRRVRRAKEARRAEGIATRGGTRAFGRNDDGSIFEAEAEAIRDVFARLLSGETVTSLWSDWCTDGVPTVKGGRWLYGSFRQMLARPDLAGLVAYKGKPIGVAKNLLPIVERETWDGVQALLAKPDAGQPGQPRPRKHLLSGIAVCSGCGTGLYPSVTVSGVQRYRCITPECPRPTSRNMLHLDEYVIAFVLRRLADERLWRRLEQRREVVAAGSEDTARELAGLRARREKVAEDFADHDDMDPALLRLMLARLDQRIEAVQLRAGSQRSVSVLDGLRGLARGGWDELPLDRRRAVVRELCTVTVRPSAKGPRFDEKSVDVEDA
jgi:DNA invertase Pin-like site-specific DNA recombinase